MNRVEHDRVRRGRWAGCIIDGCRMGALRWSQYGVRKHLRLYLIFSTVHLTLWHYEFVRGNQAEELLTLISSCQLESSSHNPVQDPLIYDENGWKCKKKCLISSKDQGNKNWKIDLTFSESSAITEGCSEREDLFLKRYYSLFAVNISSLTWGERSRGAVLCLEHTSLLTSCWEQSLRSCQDEWACLRFVYIVSLWGLSCSLWNECCLICQYLFFHSSGRAVLFQNEFTNPILNKNRQETSDIRGETISF